MISLAPADEVQRLCADLSMGQASRDPSAALQALRSRLMQPLGLKAATTRLLVSPHGALSYVPMAALAPAREVVYVPSGSTYGLLKGDAPRRGELVLGVGDPDYGVRVDPHALTVKRSGGKLTALPGTRAEVEAVADKLLLGADASETRFLATLRTQARWRAIHFACHGLVDPDQPQHSSLALTADDANDGFLKVLDIFGQRIPSDLVVLSACETGLGKIYRAEGVVGLARAFMYAGAPRVIVSLWKVEDEATRALMVKFYELWNPKDRKKGLATASALKQAQEFVASHEKWQHPSYWAAWQLWGLPD